MTDILIRDVPADVVAAVDARARDLGLSRTEYLKRQLLRDAVHPARAVTMDDLDWFASSFSDLDDPEVMARAWE